MTRWLEAARRTRDDEVLSILSVLSQGYISGSEEQGGDPVTKLTELTKPALSDAEQYLAHIRQNGPATYGAAATALGWGATRAGQAESRLRADGEIRFGKDGRAHLSRAWSESTALVGNARQGVRWSECQK